MRQRGEWLVRMAKRHGWRVGAEIGVWYGETFFRLLDSLPELVLFGVDIWTPSPVALPHHPDQAQNRAEVMGKIGRYGARASIIEKPSLEAVHLFQDGTLDFVFIDADHEYEAVCADIRAWTPKVKVGGYVTGHDYDMAGVRRAVDELVQGCRVDTGSDFVWYARRDA